ncbi:hypothetical protein BDR05DRAFT_953844 [Suillus weaverae]|nr:hypothetical protein BDR05DRAFT_953844 [Suillus weaverae]
MSSSSSKMSLITPRHTMRGHTTRVTGVVHLHGGRHIITCSWDGSLRLWDLESGTQIREDWRDEDASGLWSMALSPNGNIVASGYQVPIGTNIASHSDSAVKRTPRSSISDKSFLEADATRCHDEFGDVDELPPRFFDGMEDDVDQPSTPSQLDPHVLLARLSSLFPRSRLNTDEETSPHPTMPSGLRLDALVDHLSSFFRSQPHTNDEIELSQRSRHPRVVEVACVRDREVIFTAPPPPQKIQQQTQSHAQESSTTPLTPGTNPNTPRPRYPHSLPVRLLAHLVLFLCCASPQHPDASAQQQGQSQGQVHAQASSSQTEPAAPSTSVTPTVPDTHASAQQQQGQSQGQVHAQASSSQTEPAAPSTSVTPTVPDTHATAPGAASL